MKKGLLGAALTATAIMAGEPVESMAQETYESAQMATRELNGTARYVGMGGAMEALGADISTMGTNPAGIGMFRKAWAGVSAGVTSTSYNGKGRTNGDLNQVGFVISSKAGINSRFNIGFNYHKDRNFNVLGNAINTLNNASVNKLVAIKMGRVKLDDTGKDDTGKYDWIHNDQDDRFNLNTFQDYDVYRTTNNELSSYDSEGTWRDAYNVASAYGTHTDNSGYISNFDFNLSGNINDRIYLGVTFGLKDVRYSSKTMYAESYTDETQVMTGFDYIDDRRITGTGFDVKFGAIIRPMEESPLRFGLYINTPTWYNLKCTSTQEVTAEYYDGDVKTAGSAFSYKYRVVTPWRFGASAGHTFNNIIAVGLTYEYADYSSIKNQIMMRNDYYGGWSDDYYGSDDKYENDEEMNRNTEDVLKGVHLVKIGAEIKPVPRIAIRCGYNYESAIYNQSGSKDYLINSNYSNGAYYSTYGYTNWKDTHRLTLGFGYTLNSNWTVDLSYQFSTKNGTYHPFQSVSDVTCYDVADDGSAVNPHTESIYGTSKDVKFNRHQINCTLSYRF